jgi:hypothetical protein
MGEGLKRAKERPILFSSEMVWAILDSRKSQTRQLVKPQRYWGDELMALWKCESCPDSWIWNAPDYPDGKEDEITCPYGVAGDRLWVRETWGTYPQGKESEQVFYRSNGDDQLAKWRPSIHMPRWASRITLEITKVRVERLQDISEEDAKAEGVSAWDTSMWLGEENDGRITSYDPDKAHPGRKPFRITKRTAYATLWDSLHGKGAWEKNPWVFVIEFKRI